MEKLRVKFHILFVLFATILIYFGQGILFVNYFIVLLCHEFAHTITARKLGYGIKNITIIPFGICLNLENSKIDADDEIKIALAGPLLNFVFCLGCLSIWWLFPSVYNYTYLFFYANFVTCLFNLIPAFPLDGGRILKGIIKKNKSEDVAIKTLKIINVILIICLVILFIVSLFFEPNLTYLFVCMCIIGGLDNKKNYNVYDFVKFDSLKKNKSVVKIKNLRVDCNEKLYKVLRNLDNFSYVNLFVYKGNNLVKILTENDYLMLLNFYPATNTFFEVLKQNKGHI